MNRFSSTDPVKPLDLSTLKVAPEWVVSRKPPLATPGHHRFVWDLHYAKPTGLKDDDRLDGVWAPPGHYIVELTVAGQNLRQPLTVIADPRVKVSQADFDAEFRLAKADRAGAGAGPQDARAGGGVEGAASPRRKGGGRCQFARRA